MASFDLDVQRDFAASELVLLITHLTVAGETFENDALPPRRRFKEAAGLVAARFTAGDASLRAGCRLIGSRHDGISLAVLDGISCYDESIRLQLEF